MGKWEGMEQKREGGSARSGRCRDRRKARNGSIPPLWPCPSFSHTCCHMPALTHHPQHPQQAPGMTPWKPSLVLSPLLLSKHAVWICIEQFIAAIKHMCISYNKLWNEARGKGMWSQTCRQGCRIPRHQVPQDKVGTSGKHLEERLEKERVSVASFGSK